MKNENYFKTKLEVVDKTIERELFFRKSKTELEEVVNKNGFDVYSFVTSLTNSKFAMETNDNLSELLWAQVKWVVAFEEDYYEEADVLTELIKNSKSVIIALAESERIGNQSHKIVDIISARYGSQENYLRKLKILKLDL